MRAETYSETLSRFRGLLEQRPKWRPDELVRAAADEGQSVLILMGLLCDLFGVSLIEAKGAAIYAIHGAKYGRPLNLHYEEKGEEA
ncbi:hypothetical protein SAMN00790413_03571 [Deinococcus hopiensis KR-140]|uniref:Uncharacterized protein n=1 Tax=Deinococcus hopiensis KR-140 TaxID=695939 RepID=A0A1W1UYN7_9DEIO|nr:hypothetical protein SAMN00790413_03571 [Deinococcus hopiensis KR-140]